MTFHILRFSQLFSFLPSGVFYVGLLVNFLSYVFLHSSLGRMFGVVLLLSPDLKMFPAWFRSTPTLWDVHIP